MQETNKDKLNEQAPGIIKNLQGEHRKTVAERSQLDAERQKIQEDFLQQHPGVQKTLNEKRASEAPLNAPPPLLEKKPPDDHD
jgi:hypothetical protein